MNKNIRRTPQTCDEKRSRRCRHIFAKHIFGKNTGNAQPIRQVPRRILLARQEKVEKIVKEITK